MSMVGCGAKKGHGFQGPVGCQSVRSLHAVKMVKFRNKNDHARDSRMARALHVREDEGEERMGTATVGVSMISSSQETAELGSPNKEVSMARIELGSQSDKMPFTCETCSRVFRTKGGLRVHIARTHPEEANNAVNVERVKARWPEEEVRLMVDKRPIARW